MKLTLKSQVTILIISVVVILTVLMTALTISRLERQISTQLVHKWVQISAIMSANIAHDLVRGDHDAVSRVALAARDDEHIQEMRVFDDNMELVYSSVVGDDGHYLKEKYGYVEEVLVEVDGYNCLVGHPVYYQGRQIGCLWLNLSESHMAEDVERDNIAVYAGAAFLLFLAASIGVLLTRRLMRHTKTIEGAAQRVSAGDFSIPVDLEGMPADFVRPIKAFNQMQVHLGHAIHELEQSKDRLEHEVEERTRELTVELEERRKAEADKAEGQDLLRATLESTADGIMVVNRDGEVTHANARFAELWRIPPKLMATKDDDLLLAHVLDQLSDPDAFMNKVIALYESNDTSLDILDFKDGRIYERYSCPLVRHGSVEGRVWSFRDISERVRALDALHRSQQKLLLHFEQNPLGVIEWDLDARVTQWNPSAERIFGYARKEAIGQHLNYFLPESAYEHAAEVWEELVSGAGGERSTNEHSTKDGRTVFCEWYNTPLVDESGQVVGVASLVQDVTERRRSEILQGVLRRVSEAANFVDSVEELIDKVREEVARLIDTTNFYVALYDDETEMFSFPYIRDEYMGPEHAPMALPKSLTDYVRITQEPLLADPETFQELVASGEVEQVGVPTLVWVGVPLRTPNGTIGVMAVQDYRDPKAFTVYDRDWLMSIGSSIGRVIERKQAEQKEAELHDQLERAERMRALGILAGGVAHDLNNMLGPLVGYPDLMLARLEEGNPLRRQVEQIGTAARQAAEVVQDLLTLARRGRYVMVSLDLNQVINEYLESPSFANLRDRHARVRVALDLDRDIRPILGSAPHLRKVVMNLIVNAFDAMPQGGQLTVTSYQKELDALPGGFSGIPNGNYAVMSVRDTGVGIAAEDIEKIFEPYYSKKNMGTSGSGLGLSVVYGVVKDHNGYYDIVSSPGEGTEFLMYFPIATSEQTAPVAEETIRGGNESILIIDDDDGQRLMAAELLESLGYRTTAVASGRHAVAMMEHRSFDLLLVDMIMERDFDGLDTYREIVKRHPNQKAVIVTGFSSTTRVLEMQALGAGPHVKKPYTRQAIASAVRSTLDGIKPDPAETPIEAQPHESE